MEKLVEAVCEVCHREASFASDSLALVTVLIEGQRDVGPIEMLLSRDGWQVSTDVAHGIDLCPAHANEISVISPCVICREPVNAHGPAEEANCLAVYEA